MRFTAWQQRAYLIKMSCKCLLTLDAYACNTEGKIVE